MDFHHVFHSLLHQESLAKQCADGGMSYAERAAKREAFCHFACEKEGRAAER